MNAANTAESSLLRFGRLIGSMLWQSYQEWERDNAVQLSAALSYYTALSLAPMAIVLVLVATYLFGIARVSAEMSSLLESAVGTEVVLFFQGMLQTAEQTGSGYLAGGIGLFAVVYGASRGLMCMRDALNKIFGYHQGRETRRVLNVLLTRLVTIGLTMLILTAILVLLFLSPFLMAILRGFSAFLPAFASDSAVTMHVITFVVATLFFMIIYRVLPAHKMRWRDVAPGSLFTAGLFKAGDWVIRLYLNRTFVTSVFGAAGSFVVVLLWLYFLAQIIFFGAEFTFVYLTRLGRVGPREELHNEKSNKRKKTDRFRHALGERTRFRFRSHSRRAGSVHPAGQPVIGDGRRYRRRRDRSRGEG